MDGHDARAGRGAHRAGRDDDASRPLLTAAANQVAWSGTCCKAGGSGGKAAQSKLKIAPEQGLRIVRKPVFGAAGPCPYVREWTATVTAARALR